MRHGYAELYCDRNRDARFPQEFSAPTLLNHFVFRILLTPVL
nr:hypothetical protein [uncultured bacterium]